MNWPFDDGSDLPLRDGFDVGGAQERKMASMVGGYSGIRTVEELNPDGSITILRTRGGRPIFETTGVDRRSAQAQKYRGFVAKIPSRAVLFDPYTLDILDANYQPAVNTYSVQDFATSWNVPADDDTDWYDVVLFDGSTIKVNAKAMPTLGITANHGYPAIPYVINRETAEDQYGNAERNTTEKRVFAVGRYSVTSWGGGGVTETLTPTAPRTEDRAMTIGQRVDHATNKAWLGQLYHPAAGWDAAGEWYFTSAEITMLLASTYLVKVAGNANVAMTTPPLVSAGTSAGSPNTPHTYPATPVGMYATGNIESLVDWQTTSQGYVYWYWAGTVDQPLVGTLAQNYTREDYSGSSSSTETQAGRELVYSAQNNKYWRPITESLSLDPQTVVLGGSGYGDTDKLFDSNGTDLYWDDAYTPGAIPATRGRPSRSWSFAINVLGSTVSRVEQVQAGEFSVKLGTDSLVFVSLSRSHMTGDQLIMTPNTDYYSSFIGNLSYSGSFGMGTEGQCRIHLGTNANYHKNPSGLLASQPPAAISEINSEAAAMSSAMAAAVLFDSEASSAIFSRDNFYWSSIVPLDSDDSVIEWSSKDYILYDETNGVYISVEGEFVGVDTAATLTVILKVQTRHHTVTQTLGEYSYTYTQLVQEREIGTTGKYAMPSPQIRAIFAPLFQEQGSFKGAHYVTAEEESNGATPAHLFNFVLYPEPYSAIGTLNATNEEGRAIHFVPCNLLEMLYAFVFSQEYGVAEDGTRYPVTFTARYNDMMSTLFSSAYRVSVRDGVQGNWSDSLGADFASISTVSLHRT
jgi:hypothetical protein